MKKIVVALVCVAIAMGSCKKKADDNTEVSFNNRITKDVVLTIYPSLEDYGNATNPVLRKVIPASSTERIPGSTFTPGKTYYMDWHTDNFYQSNWFNDNYPQAGAQVAIKPIAGNNTYYTEPGFTGNSRLTFLHNNGIFSKWRAVNAYLYSVSTGYVSFWSSLTDAQKVHEITVKKNFIAEHAYKNASGITVTENLAFKVMRAEEAYIEFIGGADSSLGSMISGKLPTGTPPSYTSSAKDTVMALLPNSDYYFMMVRD